MANPKNEAKIKFIAETSEFTEQIKKSDQAMTELRSELKLCEAQFKGNENSVEALTAKKKILQQQLQASADKVEGLRQKLESAKNIYGENSTEVSRLKTQLNNAQRQYVLTENAVRDVNSALNQQEQESRQTTTATKDLGDAVDNAGDGFTVFKGVLSNLASSAITSVVSGIRDLASGLWGLSDETRELRTEMGKLDAAFTASNHSSETASATYKTLYGIIGETDQSVEAAQQIALLANNTEDAAKWANLAAGVVGRFGDALQPETFFEAANETLKLGEATGAYTQMLEGCGISVEAFNAGLAACNTEEEKQAYMLAGTNKLLGSAGEAYKQNNAQIIEANEAQSNYNNALGGLGAIVEPIKTRVVNGMAEMLNAVTGFINGSVSVGEMFSKLSGVVEQAVQGIGAKLPQLGQMGLQMVTFIGQGIANGIPRLITSAASIINSLSSGIGANAQKFLSKGLDLLNGLADSLTRSAPVLIKSGISFIRNMVQGLMNSLPELISRVPEIISKFANVINQNAPTIIAGGVGIIKDLIVGIIKAIPTLIKNIPKIITAIVDVWEAFNWAAIGKKAITLLKNGIVGAVNLVKTAGKNVLNAITDALKNLPSNLLKLGKNGVSGLVNGIKGLLGSVKTAATSIFNAVWNGIKNLPSKMLGIGKDLVKGLWNGISDMTGWVIGKIQGFGESVLSGIKRFFGIKSPSRVMRDEVGLYLAEGVGEGIAENEDAALKPMQGLVDKMRGVNVAGEWNMLSGLGGSLNYDVSAQLGDYVSSAINSNSPYALLGSLIDAIEDLASRPIDFNVDGMRFATATAGASDSVSGTRLNLRNRGLAL